MMRNLVINRDISLRLAGARGHDGVQAVLTARAEAAGRGSHGYSSDRDNKSKNDVKTMGERHRGWARYEIKENSSDGGAGTKPFNKFEWDTKATRFSGLKCDVSLPPSDNFVCWANV
jgi:hypothetical protein